jgi:PAS domain S-box-containing protein
MSEAVLSKVRSGNQHEVLRSFFNHSGMCMAQLDGSMRVIEANTDFSSQFGCPPAELSGTRFYDLLHQDSRAEVSEQFTCLLAQENQGFTEPLAIFQQKNSAVFSAELTAFAVRGDDDRLDSLMALICPEDRSASPRPPASRKLLLTTMDAHILEGVAAGVSTIQLASKLYLSRGGIEYHLDIMMRKLKVKNRPALVSKAYFMGVLSRGWPPYVNPAFLK